MRGYFGIGAEDISKPMNLGALMRTAHAFGASFFFTVNAHPKVREAYNSDTSRSFDHVPYYAYDTLDALRLPRGCVLVGVELTDDAVELPRIQASHRSRLRAWARAGLAVAGAARALRARGEDPDEILLERWTCGRARDVRPRHRARRLSRAPDHARRPEA